ncbi:NADH-quinone oxidoreductase subunit C [Fervidibacillus halotolerans]|uniref:NADH-quinone oxidoreductase subunit C n=2 Tax=Fervidibacillus halotolerans TaxID=2980027 RepID=A0A9E8RZJ5_9BACI|nr:NADH-quinone oxidoreductase subunit C [Fervidibacillus halotolerans]
MQFEYLTELHGTDFQTHMEVFLYLQSISRKRSLILKTKTDRDQPIVASVTSIWEGAMWPECEAYDLLGIRFEGHPNLHRIFLGEDWKGYPLRKDYKDENPLK